jgi:hypothetical protein
MIATGKRKLGFASEARPTTASPRLAMPSSRTTGHAFSSLILNISAVNFGWTICRTPASPSRTPTAQKTNHLEERPHVEGKGSLAHEQLCRVTSALKQAVDDLAAICNKREKEEART